MKNYQFYHIYPLGMLNQLEDNQKPSYQLDYIEQFITHYKSMNINAIYIGPIFESEYHGYDTIDYTRIDHRIGDNQMFTNLVDILHKNSIEVIVDCVFNHVSRKFWAFEDVLINREHSEYRHWFNIDFSKNNRRNDGFTYDTWDGHDELVKLNLDSKNVREYLIGITKQWYDTFGIDGLRLDACDVMSNEFVRELKKEMELYSHNEFYVVGEMVHGDYAGKLQQTGIESITNYEGYKGLYSSLNDTNYYEIAYSFKRLFGNGDDSGVIGDKLLYNFVDNHDVNRVASVLNREEHLYPLYLMLYTMKGYPSIYYKSELGAKGLRTNHSDRELRQPFYMDEAKKESPLLNHIQRLSTIRKNSPVLASGKYKEVIVNHSSIGYLRYDDRQRQLVLINSSDETVEIDGQDMVKIRAEVFGRGGDYKNSIRMDLLNNEEIDLNKTITLYPNWGRIIA